MARPEKWFDWQDEGFRKYQEMLPADFLCAVSGGGGKTWFAIENARLMLAAGEIERVIVVTFTSHLVKQWDKTASEGNINLLKAAGNAALKKGLPPDASGYICTFAALGRMSDLHMAFATERRTLVIFDEIHHLGDLDEKGKSKWGDRAKLAFKQAAFRLSLSGTPFRSNNQRIPFVRYDPVDGSNTVSAAQPDINYCYGKAVAGRVCRRVVFHHFDGPIEWTRSDHPNVVMRHSFADLIDDKLHGDRLRGAIAVTSKGVETNCALMHDMIKSANNKLNDIRKAGHEDAAGLIVAGGIPEARDIKGLLQRLTGHRAVIVHDEEDRSLDLIRDFRSGISPWIIAVRMISEGVDIPRLRVCVYATNIVEELSFMQILFRIVRRPPEASGESYFFYPADPRLRKIVNKVEEEVKYEIDEREKDRGGEGPTPTRIDKDWLGAEADKRGATVAGGTYTEDDIMRAEGVRSRHHYLKDVDILDLVKFYHEYEKTRPGASHHSYDESYNDKRDRLRRGIQDVVGRLHYSAQMPHNEIHIKLNNSVGVDDKDSATNEQLEKMLSVANEWESSLGNPNGENIARGLDND